MFCNRISSDKDWPALLTPCCFCWTLNNRCNSGLFPFRLSVFYDFLPGSVTNRRWTDTLPQCISIIWAICSNGGKICGCMRGYFEVYYAKGVWLIQWTKHFQNIWKTIRSDMRCRRLFFSPWMHHYPNCCCPMCRRCLWRRSFIREQHKRVLIMRQHNTWVFKVRQESLNLNYRKKTQCLSS